MRFTETKPFLYCLSSNKLFFVGTIGIDLERKLVLHQEKDAAIWKSPEIDREEVEEIKKFASPAHQVILYGQLG